MFFKKFYSQQSDYYPDSNEGKNPSNRPWKNAFSFHRQELWLLKSWSISGTGQDPVKKATWSNQVERPPGIGKGLRLYVEKLRCSSVPTKPSLLAGLAKVQDMWLNHLGHSSPIKLPDKYNPSSCHMELNKHPVEAIQSTKLGKEILT